MHHIPRLSEAVFVGLCCEIGSPTEVRIRREVMDTEEMLTKSLAITYGPLISKLSGSQREGFRLKTSDTDYMEWRQDNKVICDPSQIRLYGISQHTMILMECDDVPPGFTRLNLMSPAKDVMIRSSVVIKNYKKYISSILFRNRLWQLKTKSDAFFASSIQHGPCYSNIKGGGCEFESVHCLQSHHWPSPALPWIQRCRQQGWPSEIIISEILNAGFHVVPIGSTSVIEEEWRISFSTAEEILVCSLNHCQFLCYGLLKIFLKEIINFENGNPVLCSYFMKTIVFWIIQKNSSSTWKPENLLSYFWKCFQLLIYWVRIGECPNFFIPENNMFRLKVTGSVQASMFRQLLDLYGKGISCLLLSQTLRPFLNKVILNRTLKVCTDERSIRTSTELDISFFLELKVSIIPRSFKEFAVYMNQIERLIRENLSSHQMAILQCMTSSLLRNTGLMKQNSKYSNKNRTVYYNTSKDASMLRLACTIGWVSDILYLAMYFYRLRKNERSIDCLQIAQERISVPFRVYDSDVNKDLYEHFTTGMSLDKRIRKALVFDIVLNFEGRNIDELVLENKFCKENSMTFLNIPPLLMLHMLFILNYHRLCDTIRSQQSLQDLQTLLLYDDGINVPYHLRDISWQILGICQQITGDYWGSLQSYQYSLQQVPFHGIQEATLIRMNTLPYGAM